MTETIDPRLARLDTARWLAALAVVLLHCAALAVSAPHAYGSAAWLAANAYDSAVRWCVPVFVMVSGALLLAPRRQPEPLGRYYGKRLARGLAPLVFWTAFYLAWSAFLARLDDQPAPAGAWLTRLAEGRPYYHLWYLYMIVGLYLFAPFVRDWYARTTARRRLASVGAIFVIAVLDGLYRHVAGAGRGFFLTWFLPYLGYFVAGRMILAGELRVPRPGWVLAGSIAVTALGVAALSDADALDLYFYEYFSLTVTAMSLAAFQLILDKPRLPRLPLLAPLTFGIYLVHPVFLDLARRAGVFTGEGRDGWVVPLCALAVFALSAGASWAMARLPLARRLI
jgi:Uncharacterized protein conserved in bacteria